MNVLALGGAGTVGRNSIRELLKTTPLRIVIGDTALDRANAFVAELRNERVTAQLVDGNNKKELLRLIKDFDLLANYTNVMNNHIMLEAAIEAKKDYIDLTGAFYTEKLKLDGRAKKAGVTAILAMGSAPGLTNLIAKHAANQLDEVREIRLFLVSNRLMGSSVEPWAIDSMLSQFYPENKARCYFENGKFIPVPPFSGKRVEYFPDLTEPQTTYYWAQVETSMLARSISGVKKIEVRGKWAPEFEMVMQTFRDYNFFSKDSIQMEADCNPNSKKPKCYFVVPRDVLREQVILNQKRIEDEYYQTHMREFIRNWYAEVIGVKNGKKTKVLFGAVTPKKWIEEAKDGRELNGLISAVPNAIVTKMLAEGEVKGKGVFTPELAVDANIFVKRLADNGFKVIEHMERMID